MRVKSDTMAHTRSAGAAISRVTLSRSVMARRVPQGCDASSGPGALSADGAASPAGVAEGEALLQAAGAHLMPFAESHLCCGSAGSYSLLQPELAGRLRARKLEAIAATGADAVATANIGCQMHLSGERPVIHLAEWIDWAEGGPKPVALGGRGR